MKTVLQTTAATAIGEWIPIPTDIVGIRAAQLMGFQSSAVAASGTVTGTILIQGTIGGNFPVTIATITLNATTPATDIVQILGKYEAVRANVTALSANTTITTTLSV